MSMSEDEKQHLRQQAQEALNERRIITDGDAGETQERMGAEEPLAYEGIRPASPDGEIPPPDEADDEREEIITSFIVFINADGKAIATSEIDQVLANFKPRRPAEIQDMRRACQEVVEDTRAILQTQSMINTQMQMARQVQEAQKNEQLLQGLDLSKVRQS